MFEHIRTSKTKQFCATSSFFELDNIQNEAILRGFLQKWKVECRADSLVPMCFGNFPVHLSKVLRLPRKIDARSYEVLHLSRKITLANLHIWYSKMQPLSGNQRPDLLTSLMIMSFVLRLPRKMHLCRSSSNVPCLSSFLEMPQNHHVLLTFEEVRNPLRLRCETTSEPPKVVRVRTPSVFNNLTSKCASRHNGVHFFWHLNFQKWCEAEVFCTFWLRNVLRATTVCTFSTSQLPKAVRHWCVLYILTSKFASRHNGVHFFDISTSKSGPTLRCFVHFFTWKCASRHNGVQFFISHLASWLRTRRFSEPTFRPSGASNHWKNTVFRDFPTFSRICICFLLTLSLLWSSLFYSPLLSASAQLCFSSVHIVGS